MDNWTEEECHSVKRYYQLREVAGRVDLAYYCMYVV